MATDRDKHIFDDCHPALSDGRQSPAALAIARGTMRLLLTLGMSSLNEVVLPSGRRADIVALSDKGEIWIVEIKSGMIDFKTDQKWSEYLDYCDRFFFAVDGDFPDNVIPDETGLIVADRFGAEIIRQSAMTTLAAARRKVVLIRCARAAANRLHGLLDPDANIEAPSRY